MITARHIKSATAAHYGLAVSDLDGQSRQVRFAHPRMLAMYLCREHTGKSWHSIGLEFGGRHHTTTVHAHKTTAERMTDDLRDDIASIMASCPALRERQLGGVFRSARTTGPVFTTTRKGETA